MTSTPVRVIRTCAAASGGGLQLGQPAALFSFFIFKKNQNFKNICPFWNISKLPPVAPHRATGPSCKFFFFKFTTRSIAEKNERGPVAPPTGDRGSPTLYKSWSPFPSHLSPKITPKIQKKREGWGEKKRRSFAELRTCDLPVTSVWIHWYCITI